MSDPVGGRFPGPERGQHADHPAPPAPRHHAILAVLTAGPRASAAPPRAVTVQDPLATGDAIADLRSASVALSRDRRHLTGTARFDQPTSPTSQNW